MNEQKQNIGDVIVAVGKLIFFLFFTCIFISIMVFILGCSIPEPSEPASKELCYDSNVHIYDLDCLELLEIPGDDGIVGTVDDPTWEEWCEWVQDSGVDTLDLDCILNARTCNDIEECF